MIVWFFEIPLIFLFIAAIMLCVVGSLIVETVTNVMLLTGLTLMAFAIPIFIASTALQHISATLVAKCDKICLFLIINGVAMFLIGFVGKILFGV